MIGPFQGEYRWLSNFWSAPVTLDGWTYPTVEHAYVAAKTTELVHRAAILSLLQPGDAKRYGRKLTLRPDWEHVKLTVMEDLLRQKFARGGLRVWLLATGTEDIVEVNTWGDRFWGVCHGSGDNHLGRLLMQVRDELRASEV